MCKEGKKEGTPTSNSLKPRGTNAGTVVSQKVVGEVLPTTSPARVRGDQGRMKGWTSAGLKWPWGVDRDPGREQAHTSCHLSDQTPVSSSEKWGHALQHRSVRSGPRGSGGDTGSHPPHERGFLPDIRHAAGAWMSGAKGPWLRTEIRLPNQSEQPAFATRQEKIKYPLAGPPCRRIASPCTQAAFSIKPPKLFDSKRSCFINKM